MLWSALAAVVVVAAVGAVVVSAHRDRSAAARDPVIALTGPADRDSAGVVAGTLTLTGSCLSLPDGLVVWPYDSYWVPDRHEVQVSHPAVAWPVGTGLGLPGTVEDHIPSTPTALLPQSALDALEACSRLTGISSVAYVGS